MFPQRELRQVLSPQRDLRQVLSPQRRSPKRFDRVEFKLSHIAIRITHRGLDHGTGDAKSAAPHVKSLLFPQRDCYLCVERTPEYEAPLFNRNLNEEQRAAVAMATRRDNHRAPYVIFGPPGTGKTSTMVKMIKSLLKVISAFC